MDVVPGDRIGPYKLGEELFSVLHRIVEREPRPNARVCVLDGNPNVGDVLVVLFDAGLILRFDARTQRLRLIEAKVEDARLRLKGQLLGSRSSLHSLSLLLGATFPGAWDLELRRYVERYTGLWVAYEPQAFDGDVTALDSEELVSHLHGEPPSDSPLATSLFVFAGDDARTATAEGEAAGLRAWIAAIGGGEAGPGGGGVASPAFVLRPAVRRTGKDGAARYEVDVRRAGVALRPGMVFAKVTARVGEPLRVDVVAEGAPAPGADGETGASAAGRAGSGAEYVAEYPALGLDVVFSADTHRLRRVRLYANLPSHPTFGERARAHFLVEARAGASLSAVTGCELGHPLRVWTEGKWPREGDAAGEALVQPMLAHASDEASMFGHSLLYGYPGFVVETSESGDVATVTLVG